MESACTPTFRASSGFQVALASALSVISAWGCTSSYQPAPGPRIAVVMDDGAPTLVRDGHSFEAGFLGSGVAEAVEGNPAALEHAHTYRQYTIAGWTFYVGGLGLSLTGLGLWQAGERNDNLQQAQIGEALALAGVAALVTGLGFLMGAQPHLWDAINLYNDEVDRRLRLSYWPAPSAPPYATPQLPPPQLPLPPLPPSNGPQPGPASPSPASPSRASPSPASPSRASPSPASPSPARPSPAPPVVAPAPPAP